MRVSLPTAGTSVAANDDPNVVSACPLCASPRVTTTNTTVTLSP